MYLNWLDLSHAPRFAKFTGRLGMTILPGKKIAGIAGYHDRDLAADAAILAKAGVSTFVLLVEDHELVSCHVPDFVPVMNRHGIAILRCPIVDGHTPHQHSSAERSISLRHGANAVPEPGDLVAFRATLARVEAGLAAGATVAVSCRGGLGRTGIFAACLLIDGGLEPGAAIRMTRSAREGTIENARQEAFVRGWSATGLA
jgi:protein-tyrosine phosphatase